MQTSDVDCTTGAAVVRDLTTEEEASHLAVQAAAQGREAAAAAAEIDLRAAVAAHPDPIVQALARRLGIG